MKTISLELAKKINAIAKEKGVELVESKYLHFQNNVIKTSTAKEERDVFITECDTPFIEEYGKEYIDKNTNVYNAYTADELFEMLPSYVCLDKANNKYYAEAEEQSTCKCDTPCEALGELYNFLLADDLIK